jgi:hypothetical protein
MLDVSVAILQSTDSPFPPSFKCNVLRESLSVDSQNIQKEKGGNLCVDAEPVHDAGAGGPGGPRLPQLWWARPALGLPHLPRPHRSAPAVL